MVSLDLEARRGGFRGATKDFLTSKKIVVLYPGESASITLKVYGPSGHVVVIEEEGFPRGVADLKIAPQQARAPFTSQIVVSAKHGAKPGIYLWSLRILDTTRSQALGLEPITLIILPQNLPKHVGKHVVRLREVYESHGIQVALWLALRTLYPQGACFTTVKNLYELLTGRCVGKGTVGNTLRTMLAKGLLEKRNGLYVAINLDRDVLLSRVDLSRVRFPWQVLRRRGATEENAEHRDQEMQRFRLSELPQPIRRAYMHAERLAEEHNPLVGLYFLLYSLLGVRQTGHLLLWLSGWFIVLEPKTGFAHHFYSWLLHWMLSQLGLREGVYFRPQDPLHQEARETAQKYIINIYGSHQNARRLHYMLWEEGYVWSDDEVYTVRVCHYPNGRVGVQVLDTAGKEELYSENIGNKPPTEVETYTALPRRHVSRRNEETYHYRPGGLY